MTRNSRNWLGMALIAAVGLAGATAFAAPKQVLRIKLDGPILEAPPQDMGLAALFGGGEKSMTLRERVDQIRKAGDDKNIAAISMIIEAPQASLAQVEELSRAIKEFRGKGKKVHSYLDSANNLSYAIACAGDTITIAENGELDTAGLRGSVSFYKGLLEKLGMQADMLHCGAYKAALEPYTRTEPSKEFAENINWLLDGMYARWTQLIADGRHLKVEQIKAAVDAAPMTADNALKLKLIDAVCSYEDYVKGLKADYGSDMKVVKHYPRGDDDDSDIEIDPSNPFAMFTQMQGVFAKLMGEGKEDADKAGIGLIYIDGGIEMGKGSESLFGGSSGAGSTTIRHAFDQALDDEHVKIIVIRVDSPGGSALASDIMWKAAMRAKASKPIVVSMGGVAGSGGYYVSLPGEVIFAEESTITGSIGVVGGKMVWKGLFEEKLGITTTEFTRGKNAGLMSANKAWNDDERKFMQDYMNVVYTQFKGRVMTSRGERIKGELENMAGGRVYTGKQALELGLIDKIGGLTEALAYAAQKAGLPKDYAVHVLPKQKDFGAIFAELLGKETEDEWDIATPNLLGRDPLVKALGPVLNSLAPEELRSVASGLRNLLILNREHVGCFMPLQLNVR